MKGAALRRLEVARTGHGMKRTCSSGPNRTHPRLGKERGKARNGNEDETNETVETNTTKDEGLPMTASPSVAEGNA